MAGLYQGCFDIQLGKYNGRMGRVIREPPPWLVKAPSGAAPGEAPPSAPLVPVLLDSRSTDEDRSRGVWLAVPPENLKVL